MTQKIIGNLVGLKASQTAQLSRLYRRRVPTNQIFSYELAEQMLAGAEEVKRPIAVLVNRGGHVTHVVVGEPRAILLPELRKREGASRLSGWRAIIVHPGGGGLGKHDLVALAINRLDMLVAIDSENGKPHGADVWIAHLLAAPDRDGAVWAVQEPIGMKEAQAFDLEEFLYDLEREMGESAGGRVVDTSIERAILVGVQTPDISTGMRASRCRSWRRSPARPEPEVLDRSIQKRSAPDAATHIGKGKVEELALRTRELDATMVVVDAELSPSAQRKLQDAFGLKVLDRTALIWIFSLKGRRPRRASCRSSWRS